MVTDTETDTELLLGPTLRDASDTATENEIEEDVEDLVTDAELEELLVTDPE